MNIRNLLQKNRDFYPSFEGGFANHASMGLIALQRLGASEERLNDFFSHVSQRLEQCGKEKTYITNDTWMDYLGQEKHFEAFKHFFTEQIAVHGYKTILLTYLPTLLKGVGAELFHPLIRMSYALDFDDLDDISLSLAYFADTHLPLGHLDYSCGTIADPYKILKNMRQDTHLSALPNIQKSVTEKMKYIAAFPSFRNHVQSIHLHSDLLVDIALFALRLYITSPSIITLHGITATHALRLAKPSIVNFEEAIAYLWQAICTLYIVVGLPSIENNRRTNEKQVPESEWEQWKKKAVLSNNVHLIKLFYTCLEEKKIYGFSEYDKATRIILGSE